METNITVIWTISTAYAWNVLVVNDFACCNFMGLQTASKYFKSLQRNLISVPTVSISRFQHWECENVIKVPFNRYFRSSGSLSFTLGSFLSSFIHLFISRCQRRHLSRLALCHIVLLSGYWSCIVTGKSRSVRAPSIVLNHRIMFFFRLKCYWKTNTLTILQRQYVSKKRI